MSEKVVYKGIICNIYFTEFDLSLIRQVMARINEAFRKLLKCLILNEIGLAGEYVKYIHML